MTPSVVVTSEDVTMVTAPAVTMVTDAAVTMVTEAAVTMVTGCDTLERRVEETKLALRRDIILDLEGRVCSVTEISSD